MAAAELAILIKAKDEASREIEGIGSKIKNAFDAIPGPVKVAGAAVAGLGVAAVKFGGDFNEAFNTIRVGTGATGDALDGLKGDFKAVFGSVPADMQDAAQAVADLNTRLGVTGEPLQTLSKQFLELSRITGTDLGTNIETVTRAFGDWGIATEDQSAALDGLFRVSQATGPSVDELSRLIVQFGAPMRQFGFSIEETAALLGKWQKEGVNTELVMGSLRIAGGKFAKENIPLRQGLEDTIAEIQRLGPSAEATALSMEIFGARAGIDMVDAILEGKFSIEDLMGTLDEAQDTILGVGLETMSMGDKFTLLKNNVLVALEPLLTKLFDGMLQAMDWLAPKIQSFAENDMPKIMAVAGTVVAFIQQHWPTISEVIGFAFDFVKTRIEGFIQQAEGIIDIVSGVVGFVKAIFEGDWAAAWENMKQIAEGILDLLIGTIKTQFGNIPEIILGFLSDIGNAALQLGQKIMDSMLEGIGDVYAWVGREIGKVPGAILGALVDVANAAWNLGQKIVDKVLEGLAGLADRVQSAAGSAIAKGLAAAAGGIPGVSIATGAYNFITGNARGTDNWRGGLTWVGERGPELLNLPRGSQIFSNEESRRMVEDSGVGTNIVIHHTGDIYARDRDDADRSLRDIAFLLQARGLATS